MKTMLRFIASAIIALAALPLSAQQIATTRLLEMAPYNSIANPAFETSYDGYFSLPGLSHLSLTVGNSSLSMSDIIVNQNGVTMWTLNPECEYDLMGAFKPSTLIRAHASTSILGFGTRLKRGGFFHMDIDATVDAGVGIPKDFFQFALGGGMQDLSGAVNTFDLNKLRTGSQVYLSLGLGYSKQVNEHWSWGLNVKLLDGIAYAGLRQKELYLHASTEQWTLEGSGYMAVAGPFNRNLQNVYPASPEFSDLEAWAQQQNLFDVNDVANLLTPNGYGAALDLGLTYQPDKHVRISFGFADIGAIYWTRGRKMSFDVAGNFEGLGNIQYSDCLDEEGNANGKILTDTILDRLKQVYQSAIVQNDELKDADGEWKQGFLAPLTMKFNAGVDAYFCNRIIGLGLYSSTMLYEGQLYEELTVGAALRPTNWFNLGVSYSLLNGEWSNLGAALGLRGGPLLLTLAADYVPLLYAHNQTDSGKRYSIPYRTRGVNLELGISFVWGWKKKDK